MTSTRLYAAIFGVLMIGSTVQALVEMSGFIDEAYWLAFGLIMVLSTFKALLVAGYFQHLREEPRAVSYLMVGSLIVVLTLTAGAAYSIL